MSTGQFVDLMTPATSEVFYNEYDRRPHQYKEIYNVHESERAWEEDSAVTGLGPARLKQEGTPVKYDDALQGYKKRYTHATYGLGIRHTREAIEDDLSGKLKQQVKSLGMSLYQTVETTSADLFNNGFTANTGGDGVPLFSTAHPLVGGGIAANTPTIQVDLSDSSLRDALIAFKNTVDDRNIPTIQHPESLVVATANMWNAATILESQKKSGTADNDKNVLTNVGMTYFVWDYLTDDDAWFIKGDNHKVKFFWRRKPDFSMTEDFDTEDAKAKGTARWSSSHSDWRGWYGSSGQ
jgi:hypothetical protein